MNKQTFDRFRERAQGVRLPDSVRDNVYSEMSSEKNRAPRRPSVTRRAAVGVGLGLVGTAAALLAASVVARPDADDPAATPAGNWFVLRAYAEGVQQDGSTVLARQSVSLAGSLGGSESSGWYAAHSVNFACEGSGIESITYAIEGDYVSEEGQPGEGLSTCAVWLDALYSHPDQTEANEAYPDHGGAHTSFTVSYEEQAADEDNFNRQIWTSFPDDEELATAHKELEAKYPFGYIADLSWEQALEYERLNNRRRLLLEKRSGELLAQTTLVMTAACTDGSTLTRRYAIAPREDFDQAYAEFLEAEVEPSATVSLYRNDPDHAAEVEQAFATLDTLLSEPPDLYTITELDG